MPICSWIVDSRQGFGYIDAAVVHLLSHDVDFVIFGGGFLYALQCPSRFLSNTMLSSNTGETNLWTGVFAVNGIVCVPVMSAR